MKIQIKKISPHQNAKVASILMAISVLIFMLPFSLISNSMMPDIPETNEGFGMFKYMIFIFPILYLMIGYISVAIGSIIYNFLNKFIGGFEFELIEEPEQDSV